METAVFGGGCFWCLDAIFRDVAGVHEVSCGYAGGHSVDPDYESVCRGDTGHAEVVRVVFDPAVLSYRDILRVFFACHDPTTPDRQGHDIGSQYRSIICCQSAAQHRVAESIMAELTAQGVWPMPIVTELYAAGPFHAAEAYHQNYFAKHPEQGYCAAVIAPKLRHFRRMFADKLRR